MNLRCKICAFLWKPNNLGWRHMRCLCKNEDGSFADYCLGTCSQKEFKQADAVEQRSQKSTEDKIEYVLSIFLDRLNDRIKVLEEMCMNKWKDGFMQGYQAGKEDNY